MNEKKEPRALHNLPYTTSTGVKIGSRYVPPPPRPDRDDLAVQAGLLPRGRKWSEPVDWDGILIAAGVVVFVATVLGWFWSR